VVFDVTQPAISVFADAKAAIVRRRIEEYILKMKGRERVIIIKN